MRNTVLFWRNEKENFLFPGIKQNMLKIFVSVVGFEPTLTRGLMPKLD